MIKAISKVQKLASGANSGVVLNASLPISIKVAEKTGYNRYMLIFHNKKLSTKSMKSLKIGSQYWGEISSGKENIVIQNLYEKPNFSFNGLKEGLNLIEKIINESDLAWFYEHISSNLANTNDKFEFEIYTDMLFALQNKTIHVPFIYGENFGVFQMKKSGQESKIYLVFSNFAPLIFELRDFKISSITTPFKKVANLLRQKFECEIKIGEANEIYKPKATIIDFKG
ncbi:hypothetical protein [Campylobacter sp.]|uniref:hypothetical protein n=1 Tax=Campylobacter sp. TaxID=205 RepID=UPI002700FFC0|nr:hypothetical protein [Campylobacter sp.]